MALLAFELVEAKVYSNFPEDLPDRITKPRQGWVVYYIWGAVQSSEPTLVQHLYFTELLSVN